MQTLSLAIVGCGAVVEELHVPAIRRLARQGAVKVTALVDRSESQTARLHRFFPSAARFDDLATALSAGRSAAALIASPPAFHRTHVQIALAHRCNVLCEKPLATSATDVAELSQLSEKAGLRVMVGLTRRFFPSLASAAALLHQGALGSPLDFRCFEGSVYQWPIASDAAFRRDYGGGGVLMDKGVHVLDSLQWLFGPMDVTRAEDDALVGGVEGNCRVSLEGESVRGTMLLSWNHGTWNGLSIKGSLAELRVDPNEFRWIEFRTRNGSWERRPCTASWPASTQAHETKRLTPRLYEDCIYLQWIQFLRAVALGETVPVDAAAALSVARQIETAYASSTPLPETWLCPQERAVAVGRHWRTGATK